MCLVQGSRALVDCPKAKGKKMESNTEANLAQADGSDEGYSLSVTTPTICNSDNAEWILDTGAIYHVRPNRALFSSFEKLNGCYTVMGDDHPCNIEGWVQSVSRWMMG